MGPVVGRFHRHDDGTVHTHDDGTVHSHDDGTDQHGDHSGYATATERVDVLQAIFSENDFRASINREAFESNGVRALNLMS